MRKRVIRSLTSVLLSTLLLAGGSGGTRFFSDETPVEEPFTLVLATDLHYLSPALTDKGWYFEQLNIQGDGKLLTYQQEILAAFVADMLELAPDAVLLAGDLTYNGERRSHEDLAALLLPIKEAGIPVYVTPGNHDIGNAYSRALFGETAVETDTIQPEDFPEIYRKFGYGGAAADSPAQVVSRTPDELSYQVQLAERISIYMVNTNRFRAGVPVGCGLDEENLFWLQAGLAEDQKSGRLPLVVGHHNLLIHNEMFQYGYVLSNAEEVKAVLAEGGVPLYLSGHMHNQHEAVETVVREDGSSVNLRDIAGSSIMVNPHQYGVITVALDGTITYENQSVRVSEYAASAGLTDPNLLDFPAYAENFYRENQARKVQESLAESGLSDTEIETLADYAARVNVSYFAGMSEEKRTAFLEEDGYDLWQEATEKNSAAARWFGYLESVLE